VAVPPKPLVDLACREVPAVLIRRRRLPILRVLRRYGATLGEASDTYARLTGAGLTGTRTEMQLLASRLNMVGARTQVDRR
jgi:hypothetical protein